MVGDMVLLVDEKVVVCGWVYDESNNEKASTLATKQVRGFVVVVVCVTLSAELVSVRMMRMTYF